MTSALTYLETLLREYTWQLREAGQEPTVAGLFDDEFLRSHGFDVLAKLIRTLPREEVKVIAARVFSPLETPPILHRQNAVDYSPVE